MTVLKPLLGSRLRRAGLCVAGVALLVIGVAVSQRPTLEARFAASRLNGAATDEARVEAAGRLLDLGDAGKSRLDEAMKRDEQGVAVAAAVRARLATLDPADPRYVACSRPLLDHFAAAGPNTKAAILELVPELLRGPDAAGRCQEVIRAGLASGGPAETKLVAIRQALRPELHLKAEVLPLLHDATAEVRRAALIVVGPAAEDGPTLVGEEELFHFLHDADAEVRTLCAQTLRARGLDWDQISLARQLSHPDAAERLHLLTDLAAGNGVADPGPWLERLSRDADPAVRLGAARVAHESRLQFTAWLDRLATHDPDASVRRWAGYYRGQKGTVRPAGY